MHLEIAGWTSSAPRTEPNGSTLAHLQPDGQRYPSSLCLPPFWVFPLLVRHCLHCDVFEEAIRNDALWAHFNWICCRVCLGNVQTPAPPVWVDYSASQITVQWDPSDAALSYELQYTDPVSQVSQRVRWLTFRAILATILSPN